MFPFPIHSDETTITIGGPSGANRLLGRLFSYFYPMLLYGQSPLSKRYLDPMLLHAMSSRPTRTIMVAQSLKDFWLSSSFSPFSRVPARTTVNRHLITHSEKVCPLEFSQLTYTITLPHVRPDRRSTGSCIHMHQSPGVPHLP